MASFGDEYKYSWARFVACGPVPDGAMMKGATVFLLATLASIARAAFAPTPAPVRFDPPVPCCRWALYQIDPIHGEVRALA